MVNRILIINDLLSVIINFNDSFIILQECLILNASATSSAFAISSASATSSADTEN